MPSQGHETRIREVAQGFALDVNAGQAAALVELFGLMLRWNEHINLTGARDIDDLVEEHLADSLALAVLVPPSASLVDVGAGGGLPSLPFLLLRRDVTTTLVEPRAKRVAFLRTALRTLRLEASVVAGRDDTITTQFDAASSRATFAPQEWLARSERLLAPQGRTILFLSTEASLQLPANWKEVGRLSYGARNRDRLAIAAAPSSAP